METLLKIVLLGVLFYMIYCGMTMFADLILRTSSLTPEGLEWQKTHNPEFIKADALRRMADLQEQEAKRKSRD
jgi:uncharacterized membrane protein